MNAPRLPGPILQCLAALRNAFGRPRRPTRDAAALGARVELAITEDFADAAAEPAVQPRLRTLEEVRADLARLRERTRALQAQAQARAEARRDMSFAPTDFMDFADAKPMPAESPASGFAPTDFLDFGMPNLQPGR